MKLNITEIAAPNDLLFPGRLNKCLRVVFSYFPGIPRLPLEALVKATIFNISHKYMYK